jgi:superkiller protein 3
MNMYASRYGIPTYLVFPSQRLCKCSDDPTKCAESLQKLIEVRRKDGSRAQVVEALSLLLPGSPIYPVISTLPSPDPTNPTATTAFFVQSASQDFLPILEEIVALVEKDDDETINREVQKRRTRLGASGPEKLRKEVSREVLGPSKVGTNFTQYLPFF